MAKTYQFSTANGFYLRENLERVIEEFIADRTGKTPEQQKPEKKVPPYFPEYIYGETILADIDENVLRFMEKELLYSRNQINTMTKGTWEQYSECMKKLDGNHRSTDRENEKQPGLC